MTDEIFARARLYSVVLHHNSINEQGHRIIVMTHKTTPMTCRSTVNTGTHLRPSTTLVSGPPSPEFAKRSKERTLTPLKSSLPPYARRVMNLSLSLLCAFSTTRKVVTLELGSIAFPYSPVIAALCIFEERLLPVSFGCFFISSPAYQGVHSEEM